MIILNVFIEELFKEEIEMHLTDLFRKNSTIFEVNPQIDTKQGRFKVSHPAVLPFGGEQGILILYRKTPTLQVLLRDNKGEL